MWLRRPDCHASISSGWPDQPAVSGEAEGLCPLSGVWLWELENWYLPWHPSCDQTLRSQPGLWQRGVFLSTFYSFKHLTHWQQGLQQHLRPIHSYGFTALNSVLAANLKFHLHLHGPESNFLPQEEALQAFIQPETLDGPNQYFCERCKKKCDARKVSTLRMWHGGPFSLKTVFRYWPAWFFDKCFSTQGLRFLHFPYLLTLQLKRFDFDYTTMHRIKLNDRMTFPEELDMSPFIDVEDEVRAEMGMAIFVSYKLWLTTVSSLFF